MKKPIQRYACMFRKGREFASMDIDARSDRGAVRIARSYQYRDVGYLTPELHLEQVLRFNPATGAFEGQRGLEVLLAQRIGKRAA